MPEAAYDSHEGLVTIHPFRDGNGRTARLLMNLLLLKNGYPPIVIRPEDRPPYLYALDATRVGDRVRYYRLEAPLDHHLEVFIGASIVVRPHRNRRRGGYVWNYRTSVWNFPLRSVSRSDRDTCSPPCSFRQR
jgi:hypothetical protein